jgi:enolase
MLPSPPVIDEAVNSVLETKPQNPYDALSKLLQARCTPKILSIAISCGMSTGTAAVVAVVTTELGSFAAHSGIGDMSRSKDSLCWDLGSVNLALEENLKGQNPMNLSKIDMILSRMEDIDASVSIAVSMACAKAGAKHKNQKLFEFIASISGVTPQVPVPVMTMVSRAAGPLPDGASPLQDVAVCPVASPSLLGALDTVVKVHRQICANLQLPENTVPLLPSVSGSLRIKSSLSQAIQVCICN